MLDQLLEQMRIHREGTATLAWVSLPLVAVNMYAWLGSEWSVFFLWALLLASVLLCLFFLQFFRHPRVSIQPTKGIVYAPAEGKVVHIREVTESECLEGKCVQLSIFMSPFNVHVNRSPFAAEVEYFRYHRGKYLVAYHPKSSSENERTSLLLRAEGGQKVLVRQIAGLVARRIRYYVRPGDRLEAGQEFGFIKFGSRVDIFLPLGSQLLVRLGERTSCGKTPLARLADLPHDR